MKRVRVLRFSSPGDRPRWRETLAVLGESVFLVFIVVLLYVVLGAI